MTQMRISWSDRTVAELCQLVTSGGTPSRSNPKFYLRGTIPWVKTGDLRDGFVTEYDEYITETAVAQSSAKLLPRDTVLMAMYGATVGMLGVLTEPAACNQAACAMVADPELCDPRWLFYALRNDRKYIVSQANGAAQQNLSGSTIKGFSLLTPGLAEQRAIAELLGALDNKISANTRLATSIIKLLELETRAKWLATDSPAVLALSDLFELNPTTKRPLEPEPAYVDMKKLPESGSGIAGWEHREAKGGARFANGDTLLARITPCLQNRKTGYVDFLDDGQVGIGSTEFIVLRSLVGVPQSLSYFVAVDSDFRDFAIRHMVGTSGRQRVSANDLASYLLPSPDSGWLADFDTRSTSAFELTKSLREEDRTLATTRDALLPQLMSGKLRVRDAEKVLEGVL